MNRKKLKFLAAASGLIGMLTACSGGAAGTEPSVGSDAKTSPAAEAAKAANEPAELVFYNTSNGWTKERFMEEYGDPIAKKFPNYTIKFITQENSQTFPNLLAAGETVDIMLASVGLTPTFLLNYGAQSDISDLIKKFGYDLSRLEPSMVDIQRQLAGGGIYGLPVTNSSAALFYNKDLFDKFGVAYPKDGMTWDELYALAQKMTRQDGGVQYRGLTIAFQHLMFLNQLSAPHVDGTTNKALFTADKFVRSFENLARFYKIPGNELPNNKFNLGTQREPFYKSLDIAMFLSLSGSGTTFGDMNWDAVQLPFLADAPNVGPQAYPNYFYITSMSKKRDAAFQVLDYVTSLDYQTWLAERGAFPVIRDPAKLMEKFGASNPIYKGKRVSSLVPGKFAVPTMKTRYQDITDKEVLEALGQYAAGKDVNTALREAAERADKAIAAAAGK
ncbi:extracellular solute-binding protein [Paenibacillus hemerocallicola]|uniref:Extracellular solute-binding protein n=1 Tax=Paenibacillus hemerocallicola TaxID=1172614 RepID=A0A5C4T6P2_9BACL|nr:extracellular solute-binding protein [Paenibacillus hemerocallicola]TNJ63997.1 extracellular solute-binding protein [Paenibacillus hemerocallicola]